MTLAIDPAKLRKSLLTTADSKSTKSEVVISPSKVIGKF
jgi:hypothetical protein